MAEQRIDEDIQLDFYGLADKRAAIERAFEESVHRLGVTYLARVLHEDPSTISKQIDRVERKRPSADLFIVCFLLDPIFRKVCVGQCKELLLAEQNLTEGEALRLLFSKAQASWDKRALEEVADIIGRVGRVDDTWQKRAIAAGWAPK